MTIKDKDVCYNMQGTCDWRSIDDNQTATCQPGPVPTNMGCANPSFNYTFCEYECRPEDYQNHTANHSAMLFSERFCHPIEVNGNTTAADWSMCLGNSETTCPSTCAFDYGLGLIPKNTGFCAPTMMTDDIDTILECSNARDFQSCVPEYGATQTTAPRCMWRRGSVMANNTYIQLGQPLFESNLCHPYSTGNWDQVAPICFPMDSEQSCVANE